MAVTGTADKFLGGKLYALKPVSIYSNPTNSVAIRTVQKGNYVGTIYSYVQSNGKLWWHLDDNGFVMHETGKFDENKLGASLIIEEQKRQNEIEKKVEERKENSDPFGNLFSGLFKELKGIVIGIVILMILLNLSNK